MPTYTFDTIDNSYFEGRDLRVTRDEDDRTIIVQRKDGFWALNVKSEWVRMHRSEQVRTAANNLPDEQVEFAEDAAKDFFWREAEHLAVNHGFSGTIYSGGREGGWLCLEDTRKLCSNSPAEPTGEEKETVARWLNFCFDADDLRDTAEIHFDDRILEANQNLQCELSEYADWVGAVIRSLDGDLAEVTRLEVIHDRAALRTAGGWFSMATEATLVRKADGNVPSRLTADPIMEQVFQVIEARGNISKDEIDTFLDADDDHDPTALYQDEVARCINAIEDQIETWTKERP